MYRSLVLFSALLLSFAKNTFAQCNVIITGAGNQICLGSSMNLTASPAGANTYQWYENGNPIGANTDNISVSPTANSNYTVEATFGTCSVTSSQYFVLVTPMPNVVVTANNPTCGGMLMLSVSPSMGTYSWTGPFGFTSTNQNPVIANMTTGMNGQYCASVSINGCVATDCINVSVSGTIPITATNNGPVCIGDVLQLNATTVNNATYSWTGPGGFTSNLQNPTIVVDNNTQGGIYTVVVTEGLCANFASTEVVVCNTFAVSLFNDLNNDCINDPLVDGYPYQGSTVKIDSNGVSIDTIQTTSGFYYTAHGNAGDVYDFALISMPVGIFASCPISGVVSYVLQNFSYNEFDMGMECDNSTTDQDLGIYISNPTTSATIQSGNIYVTNSSCVNTNATVTFSHSPNFQFLNSNITPSSVAGNTIVWDLNNVYSYSFPSVIHYNLYYSQSPLISGDTTHSYFSVGPITNDIDLTNNTHFHVDTVVASFDPNAITAFPAECVAAGTNMQFMIQFENLGNAPAENIYVLDTLPAELEFNTMELVMSSHNMFVTKIQEGGYNIFRFDFPNIMLPDSSDHAGRHGMLVYTIDLNNGLPSGAEIFHKAGIYFDYNDVVMTNNERSSICIPQNVSTTSKDANTILYPNPANNELILHTNGTYTNCAITNSIGQQIMEIQLDKKKTSIDISGLASGIYYIDVSGPRGNEVLKFIKMGP